VNTLAVGTGSDKTARSVTKSLRPGAAFVPVNGVTVPVLPA